MNTKTNTFFWPALSAFFALPSFFGRALPPLVVAFRFFLLEDELLDDESLLDSSSPSATGSVAGKSAICLACAIVRLDLLPDGWLLSFTDSSLRESCLCISLRILKRIACPYTGSKCLSSMSFELGVGLHLVGALEVYDAAQLRAGFRWLATRTPQPFFTHANNTNT